MTLSRRSSSNGDVCHTFSVSITDGGRGDDNNHNISRRSVLAIGVATVASSSNGGVAVLVVLVVFVVVVGVVAGGGGAAAATGEL